MICLHKYVPEPVRKGYCDAVRQSALTMRSNGTSLRKIAEILEVHPGTVANWVRSVSHATQGPIVNNDSTPLNLNSGAGKSLQLIGLDPIKTRTRAHRRITLTDIAKIAQVSAMSVSNYMNHTGRLSEQTKTRIQKVIADLNYSRNPLIQHASAVRTGNIGIGTNGLTMLGQNIAGAVTSSLLVGVNESAGNQSQNILLFTDWEARAYGSHWSQFMAGHIDGLLWVDPDISGEAVSRVAVTGLPLVAVLTRHVPEDIAYVNADNIGAIVSIVRHLFELGHTRIAYAGQAYTSNYIDRLEGYKIGLQSVGLPYDPLIEATGKSEFRSESAYLSAAESWLQLRDMPTAMIFPDDRSAIAVIKYLNARGLRVPQDISVTGFDDISSPGNQLSIGLTTIRQDFTEIGRVAVDLLVKLIDGENIQPRQLTVPTQLIVRESTGLCSQR
jgi:DNA-binding LacI/PurR family transcriptional regulator